MTTIRVEVTEADIRAGVVGSCRRCPIARAVQRVTNACTVLVDSRFTLIEWRDGGGCSRPGLPQVARSFVRDFDSGRNPAPFVFDLELERKVANG